MPKLDVFHLDLYELADSCAGCGQKAYDKIPEQLAIAFEAGFEILIIGLADDVFQKRFLLHPHKRHFPAIFANALQVAVDCPQTQIDRLWLVVLDQPHLIRPQVLFRDTVVLRAVLPQGKKVRGYRVFREVCASQISFEFFYHGERPPFHHDITSCFFYSPLISGSKSSIRWTMRRCSARGGMGMSAL